MHLEVKILRLLESVSRLAERLRDDRIQCRVRTCDRICRADHAELKLVACECKRRSPVSVRRVLLKIRKRGNTCLEFSALLHLRGIARLHQLSHNVLKLVAEKYRDDRRRRLVRAESVVIAHIGRRLAQQIAMPVHRPEDACQHQQELNILVRCISRIQHVLAVVCRDRPVVVLAGTVDTRVGFLVKQASQVMLVRDALHRLHHKLIVIYRDVRRLVDRRKLMLRGGNLIVLCLCGDAQLPELLVEILHVCADALLDDTEIVILHLLSFRSRRAKKGTARKHQILPLQIEILVYEEVLLLRTDGSRDLGSPCVPKQLYNAQRLLAQRLHGAQQRCLLVKRLPCVRAECRRDAEDHATAGFLQKCRGSDVPRRVASRLERRAQSS